MVPVTEEHPPPLPIKDEAIYDVINHMKKVATLMSMFDALCLLSAPWCLLEGALTKVAIRNGGVETFFQHYDGVRDYIMDVG